MTTVVSITLFLLLLFAASAVLIWNEYQERVFHDIFAGLLNKPSEKAVTELHPDRNLNEYDSVL